jgi:hypothetical protein
VTKSFTQVKHDLAPDGALRDFYIQSTSQYDWNRFLAAVPSSAERFVFRCGEEDIPLPSTFAAIKVMQERDPTTLSMWVAGQPVCCHFFVETEIELDFEPSAFRNETMWTALSAFFQAIVDAIGLPGIVTQENVLECVIDEISPRQIVTSERKKGELEGS